MYPSYCTLLQKGILILSSVIRLQSEIEHSVIIKDKRMVS